MMTKNIISTIKNIFLLTTCSLIIAISIIGGLLINTYTIQNTASTDAVTRWNVVKDQESQGSAESAANAYVVKDGEQINDGIHTTNEKQKINELEDILKKIMNETADNSPR